LQINPSSKDEAEEKPELEKEKGSFKAEGGALDDPQPSMYPKKIQRRNRAKRIEMKIHFDFYYAL